MPRVCVAASAGGHLSQALAVRAAYQDEPHFFVTTSETARGQLGSEHEVYVVAEANRSNPFRLLGVVLRAVRILRAEQPDVIISTGAAPACLFCIIGKLLGAKVVWIDSLANVERMSLSGRIIRRIADLQLVQWEHLVKQYRGVEYAGSVL